MALAGKNPEGATAMYLSLSELDVAKARHQELVVHAERAWLVQGNPRSRHRFGVNLLRRSAGVALVRLGERLQGCPIPCGSHPA
jgi:hypothetical protein